MSGEGRSVRERTQRALTQRGESTDDVDFAADPGETVVFELDGFRYEIDLSHRNAARLRDDLKPWINAARRTGGRRRASMGSTPTTRVVAADRRAAIRRWARNNGIGVAVYGRIPRAVQEAYAAAVQRGSTV
jgi:hypothetical protein